MRGAPSPDGVIARRRCVRGRTTRNTVATILMTKEKKRTRPSPRQLRTNWTSAFTDDTMTNAAPAAARAGKRNRGARWAIDGDDAPTNTTTATGRASQRTEPVITPRVLDRSMAANAGISHGAKRR